MRRVKNSSDGLTPLVLTASPHIANGIEESHPHTRALPFRHNYQACAASLEGIFAFAHRTHGHVTDRLTLDRSNEVLSGDGEVKV
jgi:hypothetical protein